MTTRMSPPQDRGDVLKGGLAGSLQPAFILEGSQHSAQDSNLETLLGFFGVPSQRTTAAEAARLSAQAHGSAKPRLVCSGAEFRNLITAASPAPLSLHSVFVYSGGDAFVQGEAADLLSGGTMVWEKDRLNSTRLCVADDPEFCGALAGVTIDSTEQSYLQPLALRTTSTGVKTIISHGDVSIFFQTNWGDIPVFISTVPQVLDLNSELGDGIFDIRKHAAVTLPVVLYTKWAFSRTAWRPEAANACIVIDDPLLRRRHGFVNFEELLAVMKRHRFSTNIAFIPWNWRRNSAATVELFRRNPENYSISVHGSDHTRDEFGSGDQELLYAKSREALRRMAAHEEKTGIQHDRVMVFPHGALSEAALTGLKHTEFIASAGNETLSTDLLRRPIRIADFWNPAVTCYGSFPVFTRRSPHDGIENIAFDIFLGKPAIICIHHDFCRDRYQQLATFVDLLNQLRCPLNWCNLSEVVRRSFRQREISSGITDVEMVASELRLINRSQHRRRYCLSKRESDPASIDIVEVRSKPLDWKIINGQLIFDLELDPGETVLVRICYHPLPDESAVQKSLFYRGRILLRRYGCEIRDNYFVTNRIPSPARLRQLMASDSEATSPSRIRYLGADGFSDDPGPKDAPAIAGSEQVRSTLQNFVDWLDRYGETSWDHQSYFAGPIGRRAKARYYRGGPIGIGAVAPMIFSEAFLPSARRLFHRRIRLPIADAHYAMGFGLLLQATGASSYFDRMVHFLEVLQKSRCPEFQDYCWGYPFDWVTRGGTIPSGTPLITTTPYAYEAFLQAYEIDPRPQWIGIISSIVQHAARDIRSFPTSEKGSSSSYTPYDGGGVINAAAYRAFLLTSGSELLGRDDYRMMANRNLQFVLESQNRDGSWYYATDGVRDFVDHFHTCFVLKALAKINRLDSSPEVGAALEKGIEYYLRSLFDEERLPKPFSKAPRLTVYKRELYDFAECINLCLLLRKRFPLLNETLERAVGRILNRWIKPDGSFRSRRLHLGWDNVPMHRWAQSQMFRSLAFYLCETQSADRPYGPLNAKAGEGCNDSGSKHVPLQCCNTFRRSG